MMGCLSMLTLPMALLFVSACSTTWPRHDGGPSSQAVDISAVQDAVPRPEPRSRHGNPEHYSAFGKHYYVRKSSLGFVQKGIASWYGTKFHRRRTANGERYDMYAMTAAHTSLPIPTYVRVTNLGNNRSVVVRINDRGPFIDNRIIDLSYVAAAKLGMLKKGTALVEVRAINPHQTQATTTRNIDVTQQPEPSNLRQLERAVVTIHHDKLSVSGEIIGLPKEITFAGTAQIKWQPKLYLQVGSFGIRSNAERLRQTLRQSMKSEVFIDEQTTNRRTLYRVRIGPIKSVEQVEHLTTYVRRFGIHAPIPVLE
ncbi:MAG: septal ring lytic transglycosylase RlpA family protein [Gammaproteobacteria bacterium]